MVKYFVKAINYSILKKLLFFSILFLSLHYKNNINSQFILDEKLK